MPDYRIDIDGEQFLVKVEGNSVTSVNGKPTSGTLAVEPGTHRFALSSDHTTYRFSAVKDGDRYALTGEGITFDLGVKGEHEHVLQKLGRLAETGSALEMRAPMPALVRSVAVHEGEEIAQGQTVVILEAMKMENDVHAARAGKVMKVAVHPGMTVEKDQLLITLE